MLKIRYKGLSVTLFICIAILLCIKVHAFQIIDNQTVNKNKIWTVKFTDEVGFDDMTKKGITVTDSKGNKANVDVNLGRDNNAVIVTPPADGYIEGESYTLTIGRGTHSKKGKNIKQIRAIHFNVESDNNKIITFPDKDLEKAIRTIINKPSGNIYKSDVDKITDLQIGHGGICVQDIRGLENFTNLKHLSLGDNFIEDISPLKELTKLESLGLEYNKRLKDISPLKNLTNLKELYLESNDIEDISALKSLTNLNLLYIDSNNIKDISSLSGLVNLSRLDAFDNHISDIKPLFTLYNLKELNIKHNQISDLDAKKLRSVLNKCEMVY